MRILRLLLLPLLAALAAGLGYAIVSLPAAGVGGVQALTAANMAATGVQNPVTAVLLNYRGYDTLLEMFVLLLVLLGVWSLAQPERVPAAPGVVLDTIVRLLAPVIVLVAIYILWAGGHAPGGAFQAGSLLAGLGVLMLLSRRYPTRPGMARLLTVGLTLGPLAFLIAAIVPLLFGRALMQYPEPWAGPIILAVEAAATLSIGITLTALFWTAPPREIAAGPAGDTPDHTS